MGPGAKIDLICVCTFYISSVPAVTKSSFLSNSLAAFILCLRNYIRFIVLARSRCLLISNLVWNQFQRIYTPSSNHTFLRLLHNTHSFENFLQSNETKICLPWSNLLLLAFWPRLLPSLPTALSRALSLTAPSMCPATSS